ncbi:MAG: hypothetical protein ACFB9N_03655 [Geitlerinemataceae cyanobacterium]
MTFACPLRFRAAACQSFAAAIGAIALLATGVRAQSGDLRPPNDALFFQNLILAPAFNPDPQFLRGVAGGAESAAEIAGIDRTPTGSCGGAINDLPNHRIYLEDVFESLRVRVRSEGDSILVVRGPGGTWCNDDYDGRDAGIAGQWLPGAYEIWVGSYEADEFFPYELEFSEVILPSSHRDRDAIFRR